MIAVESVIPGLFLAAVSLHVRMQADIFSLGVVIFEVVSGRKPYWEKPGNFNVLAAQRAGVIPSLMEAVLANEWHRQLPTASPTSTLCSSNDSSGHPGTGSSRTTPQHLDLYGSEARHQDAFDQTLDSSVSDVSSLLSSPVNRRTLRFTRIPSLPTTPGVYCPTSTPVHRRRTTITSLRLDGGKFLPPTLCRAHWHDTHKHHGNADTPDGAKRSLTEDQATSECVSRCFQHLVGSCLDPLPQERPSAKQVVTHLEVCSCLPQPSTVQVRASSANQKLILCASALSTELRSALTTPTSATSPPDLSFSLSPISSPSKKTASRVMSPLQEQPSTEKEEDGGSVADGGDHVDGVIHSRRKLGHVPVGRLPGSFKEPPPASPLGKRRRSNSSQSGRRLELLQRQESFNDQNSLIGSGFSLDLSCATGSLSTSAVMSKSAVAEPTFLQYACVCCDDKVQSFNCFSGRDQVK